MGYCTGYFWKRNVDDDTALLLQHFERKRGKDELLFAAIIHLEDWSRGTEYVTKYLLDWFRYRGIPKCRRKGEKWIRSMEAEGIKMLESLFKELSVSSQWEKLVCKHEVEITAIVCYGGQFVRFGAGEGKCFALQDKFGECCVREAENFGEAYVQGGYLQQGAGLLLCTADYVEPIGNVEMEAVFAPFLISSGRVDQEKIEKRLGELGTASGERRGKWGCAVCILRD